MACRLAGLHATVGGGSAPILIPPSEPHPPSRIQSWLLFLEAVTDYTRISLSGDLRIASSWLCPIGSLLRTLPRVTALSFLPMPKGELVASAQIWDVISRFT